MPPRGQPLTPEQKQLLTGHVKLNAAALARAHEAIKLPQTRYPVDFTPGFDTLLPHNSKLKGLTLVERQKLLLAAESGHLADSDVVIGDILGMARTLDEEPALISQLVRIAMVRIATMTLERCLNAGDFSEATLTDLQTAFTTTEKTNLMALALIGERATVIPHFRMSIAEIERLANAAEETGEVASGPPLPGRQPLFSIVTGFFERDLRFYLRVMETNIALACVPPPRSLVAIDIIDKASSDSRHNYYLLSRLLLPGLAKAIVREAECTACMRLALTALAVEKFRRTRGRTPENLNELAPQFLSAITTDPFDGAPLRYRRLKKGYVIYSIGSDSHDDGGREKPDDWKSSDKTTYDITFTVER
jgi:hypothetical protein